MRFLMRTGSKVEQRMHLKSKGHCEHAWSNASPVIVAAVKSPAAAGLVCSYPTTHHLGSCRSLCPAAASHTLHHSQQLSSFVVSSSHHSCVSAAAGSGSDTHSPRPGSSTVATSQKVIRTSQATVACCSVSQAQLLDRSGRRACSDTSLLMPVNWKTMM